MGCMESRVWTWLNISGSPKPKASLHMFYTACFPSSSSVRRWGVSSFETWSKRFLDLRQGSPARDMREIHVEISLSPHTNFSSTANSRILSSKTLQNSFLRKLAQDKTLDTISWSGEEVREHSEMVRTFCSIQSSTVWGKYDTSLMLNIPLKYPVATLKM